MRRLVVCLDGTWNTKSDFTNIWRINVTLTRNAVQRVYYDEGVGTKSTDFLTGGGFGRGLSEKVLEAYLWLTEHWRPADEIFVFGFSRGAYTARSLVGFLSACGLLRPDAPANIKAAYELYRRPGLGRDSLVAIDFRRRYSLERHYGVPLRIKFLGVFDTVGALGLPVHNIPVFENYEWHKVYLSEIVDHAYHALAIDEHRELFAPTVWTNRHRGNLTVEQRWFVGAHANVGGGYEFDALSTRPLQWIQAVATQQGLAFDYQFRVDADAYDSAPVTDSFSEFMGGTYATAKGRLPYYRTIGEPGSWDPGHAPMERNRVAKVFDRVKAGFAWMLEQGGLREPPVPPALGVCQSLDYTVDRRVRRDSSYRPPNLQHFFPRAIWEA